MAPGANTAPALPLVLLPLVFHLAGAEFAPSASEINPTRTLAYQAASARTCRDRGRESCAACLGVNGCAWCPNAATCVPDVPGQCGDPDVQPQIGGDLTGESCPLPPPPATCTTMMITSCRGCIAHHGCAWCDATQTCRVDADGVCPEGSGVARAGDIAVCYPNPEADAKTRAEKKARALIAQKCRDKGRHSCGDCLELSGCAWCKAANVCVPDIQGQCKSTTDHVGTASVARGTAYCPFPAAPAGALGSGTLGCSTMMSTSCRSCTAFDGCAWCLGTRTCKSDEPGQCPPPSDPDGDDFLRAGQCHLELHYEELDDNTDSKRMSVDARGYPDDDLDSGGRGYDDDDGDGDEGDEEDDDYYYDDDEGSSGGRRSPGRGRGRGRRRRSPQRRKYRPSKVTADGRPKTVADLREEREAAVSSRLKEMMQDEERDFKKRYEDANIEPPPSGPGEPAVSSLWKLKGLLAEDLVTKEEFATLKKFLLSEMLRNEKYLHVNREDALDLLGVKRDGTESSESFDVSSSPAEGAAALPGLVGSSPMLTAKELEDELQANCSTYTTCESCRNEGSQCAWCLTTATCGADLPYRALCASRKDHVGSVLGALGKCGDRPPTEALPAETCTGEKQQMSCEACTKVTGCAWCLSKRGCFADNQGSCNGPADHVGHIEGSVGKCGDPPPTDEASSHGVGRSPRGDRETPQQPNRGRRGAPPDRRGQGSAASREPSKQFCNRKHATSCKECLEAPGCAWCKKSSKCKNDEQQACEGPADHVGKNQPNTLRTCDQDPSTLEQGGGEDPGDTEEAKAADAKCEPFGECDSCLQEGCAWCIEDGVCKGDRQAACKSAEDHVGGISEIKKCPKSSFLTQAKTAAMLGMEPPELEDEEDDMDFMDL